MLESEFDRSAFASSRQRDSHGHFVKENGTNAASPKPAAHPLVDSLIPHGVEIDHKVDDNTLLDMHVGNPLRRIQQLLEEIKQQKAFSFTLKGSLGIAGIALVLTTFGIFGGTKAFCSKGSQSYIGTVRELSMAEESDKPVILDRLATVWDVLTGKEIAPKNTKRLVLIGKDDSVIHIVRQATVSLTGVSNPVIATGDYNSCSRTLTLQEIESVE